MASIFDALASHAAREDVEALVSACEAFELELGHASLPPADSMHVYKVHLAAYLLSARLEDARFLWKRMEPKEGRDADAELGALWAIGKAMWTRDHAAAQAAMAAHAWSPPLVQPLIAKLQRQHLERSFALMARVYSAVRSEHLSKRLGVPVDAIAQMASAAGWTTDAETGAWKPKAEVAKDPSPPSASHLSKLTDYVAHIDVEIK